MDRNVWFDVLSTMLNQIGLEPGVGSMFVTWEVGSKELLYKRL